jgi:hypothetical protein
MGFNQQSVNDNGGVAWAKQVAQTMDPGAIDSQIQGYQNAANSLAQVQTTLQNVKNNLAASWSGDAAEQAQQSFQASINHTQQTQETILNSVIPPLQSAKSAQQTFMTNMAKVPNEQTVPSNNFIDDVGSFFGVESPAQKAEVHNAAARTQAADELNTLSSSYETSASQLQAVSPTTEGHLTESTSAFNLGPVETSSGDGAASGYSEGVSTGGTYTGRSVTAGAPPSGTVSPGPDPKTNLSGTGTGGGGGGGGTITEPPPGQVGSNPSPNPFEPDPIWGGGGPVESDPGYGGGSGLITDEPGGGAGGGGGLGDGDFEGGSGKLGSGSGNGVFDETGMGDGELTGGTGTGLRNGMSNSDGSGLGGEGDTVGGGSGSGGMADGEGGESGMGGGSMGRGMGGGFGSGDEELASSKYSRGRYIGTTEEDDSPSLSPVRSAFEDATDADGNKVDMMGSGRSGASGEDEEDERGKRPSYLKEDEFWKNAQRIVPPVIQ